MKEKSKLHRAALFYASHFGWQVFPVRQGDKRPAVEAWNTAATCDQARIDAWWGESPNFNIGVALGLASGVDVMDVDSHNGGEFSLGDLIVANGKLPDTPTVMTPHGGSHYYFLHPDLQLKNNNNGLIGPGIDFKTTGGYCVLPPSQLIEDGRVVDDYVWESSSRPIIPGEDGGIEFAPLPPWVAEKLVVKPAPQEKPASPGEKIHAGGRHKALVSLAGTLRRRGADEETIFAALCAYNHQHCDPPKTDTDIRKIAKSFNRYDQGAVPEDEDAHLTDTGNAQRFASQHRSEARYCVRWAKWLAWNGQVWTKDSESMIWAMAKATVRDLYDAASSEQDEHRRTSLAKHAIRSESVHALRAMVTLAQSEDGIPAQPDEFDAHPDRFNCSNGTIDLRTGELAPHDPEQFMTRCSPIEYQPGAVCPKFNLFLNKIFLGNGELIRFIQKAAGYSLTGHVDERCLFILFGGGKNGKSTLQNVISGIVGDYSIRTPVETILAQRDNGIPNDVAALMGTRFVYTSEADEGRRLSEARIKELAGGSEKISARFMRGEWFEFKPSFKVWFSTNHKPVVRGTDNAIWDRIRLVPFQYRFEESERRPEREVLAEFAAEAPGILAWMVEGAKAWYREGLKPPREVSEATGSYRSEMDILGGFLEDRAVAQAGAMIQSQALYKHYESWCTDNGEKPVSQKMFSRRLDERGIQKVKQKTGAYWVGLRLRMPGEIDSETVTGGDGLITVTAINTKPAGVEQKTLFNPSSAVTDPSSVTDSGGTSQITENKKTLYRGTGKTNPDPSPVTDPSPVQFLKNYQTHVKSCQICLKDGSDNLCPEGRQLFDRYMAATEQPKEQV